MSSSNDKPSEQQRALEVIAELADDFGLPLGTTIEQVATHARYLQQERARLLFAQSAGTRIDEGPAVCGTKEGDERIRSAIAIEKKLCALLGREWSVTGISIETLVDELCARSASVPSEDAACKVAADLLRNEMVRLETPKAMFPQEAEKIGRRQTAFQEAIRFLDPDRANK